MLFLISWSIPTENRMTCWNVFGNMTPEDDDKDTGPNIKVQGRWHRLGGSGGICVAETDDLQSLNSWVVNWSPICNITVEPIVNDESARETIKTKPFFVENVDNNV